MAISFNKKELEKKKQTKKQEKLKRREERKAEGSRSFEDMIAYVDEHGQLTNTPPDLTRKKEEIEVEDILISTPKKSEEEVITDFNGRVEFFNESKGFGFIKDLDSAEKYFFHINNAPQSISERDLVTFKLERGKKGMNAVEISITKKK